jgi:DNA-binding MarR family transcriptional regulator
MAMRVFHLVQRAHAALYRAADRLLDAEFGVTAAQLGLLFVLRERDGRPLQEVARQLSLAPSSLTGLVDRALARGLVRKAVSAADARSQLLWITPAGRTLAEAAAFRVARLNGTLLAPYSPEERATIHRFLDDLATNADALVSGRSRRRQA